MHVYHVMFTIFKATDKLKAVVDQYILEFFFLQKIGCNTYSYLVTFLQNPKLYVNSHQRLEFVFM